MTYANVVIDITLEKLDKTFQYSVPEQLEGKVVPGAQVVVPFGAGGRQVKGFVLELTDTPEFDPERTKAIAGIAKDSIPVESQLIALAAWMKQNYGSTMSMALKTVLPVKKKEAIRQKKDVELILSPSVAAAELAALRARKGHSMAKEQLLAELIDKGAIPWELLVEKLHIPTSTIRDCEKRAWLRVVSTRTYRDPVANHRAEHKQVVLNAQQQAAVDAVLADRAEGLARTYLLHGVTGSGKTQVYMELLEACLAEGKSAIVLIPEIALTYQTVMRFIGRFGSTVSIINSRMSPAERFDQFERAKAGDIRIIVGPRSALFTPFSDLGLIVIDEEHEGTYKSETVPRYHARETAIARAKLSGASVVLGSATPSLESFYRASTGEYRLLSLSKRVEERPLPECEVIDMRQELKEGNRSVLSRRLHELIADRLAKKEQTMLFVNRRGLLSFVSCRACGHVLKCPHCDVSMSLHRGGELHCHYCGHKQPQPTACPECGSKYIGGFKAGTQRFEELVAEAFPEARILRMDMDTTKGKGGHQEILEAFANQEADILIGTQMIVKGHDFPNVTLVAALAADTSLAASDFRASERTFQLLTQAAGRAGRGTRPGQVIFQTYQPEHFAIQAAKAQDYHSFYETELAYRRLLSYPPASHMLLLQLSSVNEAQVAKLAAELAAYMEVLDDQVVLIGPTDASIAKVADVYRKHIYLRHGDYSRLVAVKDKVELYLQGLKGYSSVNTWFDFDPMSGF